MAMLCKIFITILLLFCYYSEIGAQQGDPAALTTQSTTLLWQVNPCNPFPSTDERVCERHTMHHENNSFHILKTLLSRKVPIFREEVACRDLQILCIEAS